MTEFKLPNLGENIDSASVAEVHVAEGDVIEAGQIVLEVETEKAIAEVPCPHAGRVAKVHVSAGDTVSVGNVILTVDETVSSKGAPSPAKDDGNKSEGKAQGAQKPAAEKSGSNGDLEEPKKSPAQEPKTATKVPSPAQPVATDGKRSGTAPAGPATRRLARELGVDLFRTSGSGRGGRITQEDVARAYASTRGGTAAPPPLPDFTRFGPIEREPLNKIAKASAANLSTAWQTIPHVTQHDLADVTDLDAARRRFLKKAPNGPKVTMTAIAVKAAVVLLKEFPQFNSSLDFGAGELILKRYYHIGVAVDTPHGLLVPVVRDADTMSALEIASELTALAEKARNRKLSLDDMQGATFTITNLGGIGGTAFTPIVNFPEVAILGLSRTRNQVEVVDGEFAARLMLPISLSYDHRVINGADAARFAVRLSALLSDPFQLLAES